MGLWAKAHTLLRVSMVREVCTIHFAYGLNTATSVGLYKCTFAYGPSIVGRLDNLHRALCIARVWLQYTGYVGNGGTLIAYYKQGRRKQIGNGTAKARGARAQFLK